MKPTTRKEAIQRKMHRYYTGKPCKYGHIAERYTVMGNCVECAAEHQRRDREIIRQYLASE